MTIFYERTHRMRGMQRRVLMEFLEWLHRSGFRITEVGTRPPRTLSAEEVLDRYQGEGK